MGWMETRYLGWEMLGSGADAAGEHDPRGCVRSWWKSRRECGAVHIWKDATVLSSGSDKAKKRTCDPNHKQQTRSVENASCSMATPSWCVSAREAQYRKLTLMQKPKNTFSGQLIAKVFDAKSVNLGKRPILAVGYRAKV
jgi:hypothetical protein